MGREPVEVGIAALLLGSITEDAKARADEDGKVERLLRLAAKTFPCFAVEGIKEIRLVVAIAYGSTKLDDALLWLD